MKLIKKVIKKIFIIFLLSSFSLLIINYSVVGKSLIDQKRGWTFLVYMQSDEHLLYWAVKNISDMALAQLDENIDVLVQLYVQGDIAWRYRINNGLIELKEAVPVEKDCVKDVVKAMDWAVTLCPAKHYCLTFWNHGFGILDPVYVQNSTGFAWEAEPDEIDLECINGACPIKSIYSCIVPFKGLLFNFFDRTYMTNQMMLDTLSRINKEVLNGKKLDILGMDCCKMAMVEVGYQIKDYVDYFVGSQNCELADGWNYKGIFENVTSDMLPEDVVKTIIDTYGQYCEKASQRGVYTLSVLNLNRIDKIVDDINKICSLCKEYLETNPEFKSVIRELRAKCVYICDAPFYTDLDSFYCGLLDYINENLAVDKNVDLLKTLADCLSEGRKNIQEFIVANCTGINIQRAQGCSIYFPYSHIDSSYLKTLFAQDTGWVSFLDMLINSRNEKQV